MAGDEVALMQQLHDEHAAALWGYCLRLTGHDRARAEDVVQETLLRAWRNRDVLDNPPPAVRGWLFTVARNIVIDEWRSRRARSETPVADVPGGRHPGRQHRPAAALVGRRRGDHPTLGGAPRRAARVLLPGSPRVRGGQAARHTGGNREVPHPLRAARAAARPRRDGGGAHEHLRLRRAGRLLRPRGALARRAPGLREAPGHLRGLRPLRARAGRAARAARRASTPSSSSPRRPWSRCPRRCCPRSCARSAAAGVGRVYGMAGLAAAAAVAIGLVFVQGVTGDDNPPAASPPAASPSARPGLDMSPVGDAPVTGVGGVHPRHVGHQARPDLQLRAHAGRVPDCRAR